MRMRAPGSCSITRRVVPRRNSFRREGGALFPRLRLSPVAALLAGRREETGFGLRWLYAVAASRVLSRPPSSGSPDAQLPALRVRRANPFGKRDGAADPARQAGAHAAVPSDLRVCARRSSSACCVPPAPAVDAGARRRAGGLTHPGPRGISSSPWRRAIARAASAAAPSWRQPRPASAPRARGERALARPRPGPFAGFGTARTARTARRRAPAARRPGRRAALAPGRRGFPHEPPRRPLPGGLWARWSPGTRAQSAPGHPAIRARRSAARAREAVAEYLRTARAVRCEAEQIMITSGSAAGDRDRGARAARSRQPGVGRGTGLRRRSRAAAAGGRPPGAGAGGSRRPRRCRGRRPRAAGPRRLSHALAPVPPRRDDDRGAPPAGARLGAKQRRLDLEDDYDSEYRYGNQPIAALQGLDRDARWYLGTFSKVLFPALRVGYMAIPADLGEPLAAVRATMDICPPGLVQTALAEFLREGHFARHVRKMRVLVRGAPERAGGGAPGGIPWRSPAAPRRPGRHASRRRLRGGGRQAPGEDCRAPGALGDAAVELLPRSAGVARPRPRLRRHRDTADPGRRAPLARRPRVAAARPRLGGRAPPTACPRRPRPAHREAAIPTSRGSHGGARAAGDARVLSSGRAAN